MINLQSSITTLTHDRSGTNKHLLDLIEPIGTYIRSIGGFIKESVGIEEEKPIQLRNNPS